MRVHRNLHAARKGAPQWVVTKGGRVDHYERAMLILNVTTRIQKAGAAKCKARNVRAVCAFFDATSQMATLQIPGGDWKRATFDPRTDRAFSVRGRDGFPLFFNRADAAYLTVSGACYVLNPTWSKA